MAATVKDVAARAGVSTATVSRYLNGHTLRSYNATRIKQAIAELEFEPNLFAKGLKANRSMTVAALIPSLSGLFSFEIIKGMEAVFDRHDYLLVINDYELSSRRLEASLRRLQKRSIDGLVLFPLWYGSQCVETIRALQESGVPVVAVHDRIAGLSCDLVAGNEVETSSAAVQTLTEAGHRRIAVVAGRRKADVTKQRLSGARRAAKQSATGSAHLDVLWTDYSMPGARVAVRAALSAPEPPTALYAISYYTTTGAALAIRDEGLSIPEDVSLIGHDRFSATQVIEPELSLVEFDLPRLGEVTAEILLRRISGNYHGFPATITVPMQLSTGASVARPRRVTEDRSASTIEK